jgi:hypothetical protein
MRNFFPQLGQATISSAMGTSAGLGSPILAPVAAHDNDR